VNGMDINNIVEKEIVAEIKRIISREAFQKGIEEAVRETFTPERIRERVSHIIDERIEWVIDEVMKFDSSDFSETIGEEMKESAKVIWKAGMANLNNNQGGNNNE
jgi:hypothetical protein